MIQANELRIGNYILFSNNLIEPEFVKVNARFFSCLAGGRSISEIRDNEQLGGYHQPIPLTPEILEKCGFEKDNSSQFGGYLISIGEGEKMRIINDESHGWHYPLNGYQRPKTNYLHQLQNLYFARTGEELKVKL